AAALRRHGNGRGEPRVGLPAGRGQTQHIPRRAEIAAGAGARGESREMNHNHLSEEELILHYYGEEGERPDAERRLEECAECRALYASLQRTLNVVDALPVPERDAEYGARVWRRIEAELS